MKVQLKLILPIALGLVSAILMVWDLHNQRVIMSMGMAWDTGAPLWPYQTPDTLLFAVNTPAFLISNVGSNLGLIGPLHYIILFPAILAWWWLVGRYLDKNHSIEPLRKAPIGAFLFCLLAIGLIVLGVDGFWSAYRWWRTYSRTIFSTSDLILLRSIAPSIWCFVLAFASLLAARRRARIGTFVST